MHGQQHHGAVELAVLIEGSILGGLSLLVAVAGTLELLVILGPIACCRTWWIHNAIALVLWLPTLALSAWLLSAGWHVGVVYVSFGAVAITYHMLLLFGYWLRRTLRRRQAMELPTQQLLTEAQRMMVMGHSTALPGRSARTTASSSGSGVVVAGIHGKSLMSVASGDYNGEHVSSCAAGMTSSGTGAAAEPLPLVAPESQFHLQFGRADGGMGYTLFIPGEAEEAALQAVIQRKQQELAAAAAMVAPQQQQQGKSRAISSGAAGGPYHVQAVLPQQQGASGVLGNSHASQHLRHSMPHLPSPRDTADLRASQNRVRFPSMAHLPSTEVPAAVNGGNGPSPSKLAATMPRSRMQISIPEAPPLFTAPRSGAILTPLSSARGSIPDGPDFRMLVPVSGSLNLRASSSAASSMIREAAAAAAAAVAVESTAQGNAATQPATSQQQQQQQQQPVGHMAGEVALAEGGVGGASIAAAGGSAFARTNSRRSVGGSNGGGGGGGGTGARAEEVVACDHNPLLSLVSHISSSSQGPQFSSSGGTAPHSYGGAFGTSTPTRGSPRHSGLDHVAAHGHHSSASTTNNVTSSPRASTPGLVPYPPRPILDASSSTVEASGSSNKASGPTLAARSSGGGSAGASGAGAGAQHKPSPLRNTCVGRHHARTHSMPMSTSLTAALLDNEAADADGSGTGSGSGGSPSTPRATQAWELSGQ